VVNGFFKIKDRKNALYILWGIVSPQTNKKG